MGPEAESCIRPGTLSAAVYVSLLTNSTTASSFTRRQSLTICRRSEGTVSALSIRLGLWMFAIRSKNGALSTRLCVCLGR
jgi:hypothetical protein